VDYSTGGATFQLSTKNSISSLRKGIAGAGKTGRMNWPLTILPAQIMTPAHL